MIGPRKPGRGLVFFPQTQQSREVPREKTFAVTPAEASWSAVTPTFSLGSTVFTVTPANASWAANQIGFLNQEEQRALRFLYEQAGAG